MHSEKFYTMIGIFVIGAFFLMLTGGVFLYNDYLHSKSHLMYVMFFKGSLKGLNSSTPVTYRGIKIGEVKLIEITENTAMNKVRIPVYVQFFVEKTRMFSQDPIQLLMNNGYVAQVSNVNFITGNAEIELVKSEVKTVPKDIIFNGYPIFPTRNRVEIYPSLNESIKAAKLTFEAIRELVTSKEITKLLQTMTTMSDSMNALANRMDKEVPPALLYFGQTMQKISEAAASAQNLTDYVSRNPESLLRGKQ